MTTSDLRLHLYTTPARLVAALLVAASGASVPLIALLVLRATDPPILPPVLARLFLLLTVLPAAGAWLVGRLGRVRAGRDGDDLVLERPDLRVAVPRDGIAGVTPWTVPLPRPGLSLRLRSGRRLRWSLAAADLVPLLTLLAGPLGVADAGAARSHPVVVWAAARAAHHRRDWRRLILKFPVFGLVPAGIFFNTHQWIAYGGTLGQYYQEGLGPYLATFAVYWVTLTIYLALYAGLWRGLAEAVCLAGAWLAPRSAEAVRRTAERVCRVAYFAGVPVVVALRYLGG